MKPNSLFSKIKNQINNGNLLYALIICLLLFSIFPFIYLIQYNLPGASDDMLNSHVFKEFSYFDAISEWYKTGYNGRYANSALLLLPGRPYMNVWFARTIPHLSFLCLLLSAYFLVRSIFKNINIKNSILITLTFVSFYICFIPSIREFYWFSGSSVYILPAILYLLMLGLLISFFNKNNNPLVIIALIVCLFFTIGSHEAWVVLCFFTILGFVIFELINKRKFKLSTYIIIACTLVLTYFFIKAPGNTNRFYNESQVFDNGDFLGSAIMSTFESMSLISKWFVNFGFLLIIVAILTYPRKNEQTKYAGTKTILLVVAILLSVFISVFILKFSLGHLTYPMRYRGIIPGYTIALILFLCLLLNSRNVFYIKERYKNINLSYALLLLGLIFNITSSENLKDAYVDIVSHRAKIESEQVQWVENFISSSDQETIYIPSINKGTKTLYFLEIPEPNTWYAWVLKVHTNKNIFIDHSLNFEKFQFSHDSTTLSLTVNPQDEFSHTHEFPIDDIKKNNFTKLRIRAIINNDSNISHENKILLVIQCGDFWKAYNIEDLKAIHNNGLFSITHNINTKILNSDVLKVYFWNTEMDSLNISKFKIYLEE